MKRYDPRHDESWFLGASAYQWTHGVLPISAIGLCAGLSHPGDIWHKLIPGAIVLVVMYVFAWTAWLFE